MVRIMPKLALISGSLANAFKSPWFWLIVSGYLLRILLMPLTGQHDVIEIGKRFVLYGVLLNALEKVNYMDSGLA